MTSKRLQCFSISSYFWVEHRDRAASRLNHGPDKRSWFSRPRPLPAAAAFSRRRRRCLHEGTYPPEIPEATTAPRRVCTRNGTARSLPSSRDAVINGRSLDLYARAPVRKRIKVRVFSPAGQKASPRRRYGTVSNFREALRS